VSKFKIVNIATTSEDPKSSILLIYTGGTFGMVYDDDGALAPFNFSLVLEKIPELHNLDLRLTVVSFPEPVDSSNINMHQWQDMGQIVFENYNKYDGFVILHGTDTMAYSSSALSFMFKGVNKPIIFTGAQIPIGATRSDARENLITALEIASMQDGDHSMVSEVCLYFNYYLLKGNRAQKIRSSNFAAFESENYPYLAESGVEIVYNDMFLKPNRSDEKLEYNPELDPNVVILKIFPNISPEVVKGILGISGLKGVILESFGSGNTMNYDWFINLLEKYLKQGLVIINVSQCIGGSVNQGLYETSKKLSDIGVVSGQDITTEAAVVKMMHLLATESSPDKVRKKMSIPLRGEMSV
jgi:L-asparaginase